MNLTIKPGMIGLSGGSDLIQKLIAYFTGSIFSHSFILIQGPYNIISIMETTETIITVSPLQNKIDQSEFIQIWEPTKVTGFEIINALQNTYFKYPKQWYGYLSYIWFLYRWVIRKFGKEPKRMWKWAKSGITCTELTCYYLQNLNERYGDLFNGRDIDTISPEELLKIMKNYPKLFRCVGWLKRRKV